MVALCIDCCDSIRDVCEECFLELVCLRQGPRCPRGFCTESCVLRASFGELVYSAKRRVKVPTSFCSESTIKHAYTVV